MAGCRGGVGGKCDRLRGVRRHGGGPKVDEPRGGRGAWPGWHEWHAVDPPPCVLVSDIMGQCSMVRVRSVITVHRALEVGAMCSRAFRVCFRFPFRRCMTRLDQPVRGLAVSIAASGAHKHFLQMWGGRHHSRHPASFQTQISMRGDHDQ